MLKFLNAPSEINGVKVYNDIFEALKHLKNNEQVARFEYGESMYPILKSGEYCILTPIKNLSDVNVGDAVFCNVNGYYMTHMVILKSESAYDKPKFLIGDTRFNFYGWTDEIFAKAKGTDKLEKPVDAEFDSQICKLKFISYEVGHLIDTAHYIRDNFNFTLKESRDILKNNASPILGYYSLDKCAKFKKELEKIGCIVDYDETESEETYDVDDTPSAE